MNHTISTYVKARGTPNGIPTGIDWAKADRTTEAGRKQIAAAITAYFKDLREARIKTTRTGHLGNLPAAPDVADVHFHSVMEDLGVMSLFREVDMRSSKNSTYKSGAVSLGGVTFEQKKEGEPAKIKKVSDSALASVDSVTWHGALGIDDEVDRFDYWGVFEQNVQAVPGGWDNQWATTLTALITALGAGVNETWSTDLITTINNGCAQILEDAGDRYGVPDNTEFALLYNHRRATDVRKALVSELTIANDNNSGKQLEYSIRPVKTRKITTTSLYLCLPGYEMVDVVWDDLFSEQGRDHRRGADDIVWRARRNAAINDVQQVRRITPA